MILLIFEIYLKISDINDIIYKTETDSQILKTIL